VTAHPARHVPVVAAAVSTVTLVLLGVTVWKAANNDDRLERALVVLCERGNVVRAELNRRRVAVRAYAVEQAVEASPEQASSVVRLAGQYRLIPLVDCKRAVRKE